MGDAGLAAPPMMDASMGDGHGRCQHGRRFGRCRSDAELGIDPALAAQALPEEHGPSRSRSVVTIGWLLLAIIVGSVIGTLALAPSAVMSVLPGAARLYALFGVPVGAHGLAFEGVRYGWTNDGGQTVLEVQGDVVNLTSSAVDVPTVVIALATRAARKSPSGPPRSVRRSLRPASTRRSCARSRRRRAMSAASRCASPRPSRNG